MNVKIIACSVGLCSTLITNAIAAYPDNCEERLNIVTNFVAGSIRGTGEPISRQQARDALGKTLQYISLLRPCGDPTDFMGNLKPHIPKLIFYTTSKDYLIGLTVSLEFHIKEHNKRSWNSILDVTDRYLTHVSTEG